MLQLITDAKNNCNFAGAPKNLIIFGNTYHTMFSCFDVYTPVETTKGQYGQIVYTVAVWLNYKGIPYREVWEFDKYANVSQLPYNKLKSYFDYRMEILYKIASYSKSV